MLDDEFVKSTSTLSRNRPKLSKILKKRKKKQTKDLKSELLLTEYQQNFKFYTLMMTHFQPH